MIDTRSAETMYDQELKRILFDYKSYIQTTNNDVNPNNYKTIQINTFNVILSPAAFAYVTFVLLKADNTGIDPFCVIDVKLPNS